MPKPKNGPIKHEEGKQPGPTTSAPKKGYVQRLIKELQPQKKLTKEVLKEIKDRSPLQVLDEYPEPPTAFPTNRPPRQQLFNFANPSKRKPKVEELIKKFEETKPPQKPTKKFLDEINKKHEQSNTDGSLRASPESLPSQTPGNEFEPPIDEEDQQSIYNEPEIKKYTGKENDPKKIIDFYVVQIKKNVKRTLGAYSDLSDYVKKGVINNICEGYKKRIEEEIKKIKETKEIEEKEAIKVLDCVGLAKDYSYGKYVVDIIYDELEYSDSDRIQFLRNADIKNLLFTFDVDIHLSSDSVLSLTDGFFFDKNVEALKAWCTFMQETGNAGELAFAIKRFAGNEKTGLEWFQNIETKITALKYALEELEAKRTQKTGWFWWWNYEEEEERQKVANSLQAVINEYKNIELAKKSLDKKSSEQPQQKLAKQESFKKGEIEEPRAGPMKPPTLW